VLRKRRAATHLHQVVQQQTNHHRHQPRQQWWQGNRHLNQNNQPLPPPLPPQLLLQLRGATSQEDLNSESNFRTHQPRPQKKQWWRGTQRLNRQDYQPSPMPLPQLLLQFR
jgi:hypothetical protein